VSDAVATPTRGGFRGGFGGGRGGGRGGFGGGRGGGEAAKGLGDDRNLRAAGRKAGVGGTGRRGEDRGGRGGRGGFRGGMRRGPGGMLNREFSVNITADWLLLETVELSQLSKLSSAVPEAEDLKWAGELQAYDEEFDRANRCVSLRCAARGRSCWLLTPPAGDNLPNFRAARGWACPFSAGF